LSLKKINPLKILLIHSHTFKALYQKFCKIWCTLYPFHSSQ
jgi:hypothetical protein